MDILGYEVIEFWFIAFLVYYIILRVTPICIELAMREPKVIYDQVLEAEVAEAEVDHKLGPIIWFKYQNAMYSSTDTRTYMKCSSLVGSTVKVRLRIWDSDDYEVTLVNTSQQ